MKQYGYNNCGPDEKKLLEQAIELANTKKYSDFGASELTSFRTAYTKAQNTLKNTSSKSDDYKNARVALETAMGVNKTATSVGKSYTANDAGRGDEWDDDGKRLTDGVKASADPSTDAYAGWKNNAQITVDLGSSQSFNSFIAYLAGGDWGIEIPKSNEIALEISVSSDGTNFKKIETSTVVQNTAKYGNWQLLTATANASSTASGRYVRFDITCTAPNNFIWMDEVEVVKGEAKLSGGAYVSKMNAKVSNGECVVFTSSFGELSVANAGIAWTHNVVAKWNESAKAYVVTYSEGGKGKIQPKSGDGLAFYYTAVPTEYNFTLRARVTIDSWKLSNGQEGFGLIVTDRLGENGVKTDIWNNSYLAGSTKIEYKYNSETEEIIDIKVVNDSYLKFSMKLGIGSIERIGVTKDNLHLFEAMDTDTINNYFISNYFNNWQVLFKTCIF